MSDDDTIISPTADTELIEHTDTHLTDTLTSMKERLQRVLAGQYWDHALKGPLGNAWISRDEFVETRWPEFAGDADAVLSELQEPSEGMLGAGGAADTDDFSLEQPWRAIIQHIRDGGQ